MVIRLDKINPSMAATLVRYLTHWSSYPGQRGAHMRSEALRIVQEPHLSVDVKEILSASFDSELANNVKPLPTYRDNATVGTLFNNNAKTEELTQVNTTDRALAGAITSSV